MEIICISPEFDYEGEIQIVNQMLDQGLDIFHLRKPGYTFDQMDFYLSKIHSQYLNKVVINSHYSLNQKYDLKGIHIKENQRNKLSIDQINDLKNKNLSSSIHELKEDNKLKLFNYLFMSPVFNSISKEDYVPKYSLDEINQFINKTKLRLIALGGVSKNNINKLKNINFHGIAVLGSIWNSTNPFKSFLDLREELK